MKNERLERLIKDLASNFKKGDEKILEELIEDYSLIASNNSNRKKDDEALYPYIYKAVKSAYLLRGDEGKTSSNVGSISSSYEDIEKKLAHDVIAVRILP